MKIDYKSYFNIFLFFGTEILPQVLPTIGLRGALMRIQGIFTGPCVCSLPTTKVQALLVNHFSAFVLGHIQIVVNGVKVLEENLSFLFNSSYVRPLSLKG